MGILSKVMGMFGGCCGCGAGDSVADLSAEEQKFLDIVRPLGLDWRTPRAEYERKYGVTKFHEFSEIIEFPPTTIFTKEPIKFHINFDKRFSDLPPEHLSAYYNPHGDARKNFEAAKASLTALLGQGDSRDVSNCLQHDWKFGIFEVALRAWPSEIQPHYLKGTDVTYHRYPELVEAATIALSSRYPLVFPDKDLEWIADLMNGKPVNSERKILRIPAGLNSGGFSADLRRTRRNPDALLHVTVDGEVVAWKTEIPGRIGVTYKKFSLVFDMTPQGSLILGHVRPARGPGGSEIGLEEVSMSDPRYPILGRKDIICNDDINALDELAGQLSAFWNLPIRTVVSDAD